MPDGRRYDADASRSAILEAAEKLFMEKGFAATSMSQLAKAAGVTKSLIHHHFGSKEALWEALKASMFAEFHDQQMTMLEHQAADDELLQNSFVLYFRFLRRRPELLRLQAWTELEHDRERAGDRVEISDVYLELMQLAVQRIREGQERGLVRDDVPAPYILISFLGVVETWFRSCNMVQCALVAGEELVDGQPQSDLDERFLQSAISIFFDGVRPRA